MLPLPSDATEGDVETQILLPLLSGAEFLHIPLDEIRSKRGIAARDIGKGSKKKPGYVPDFCVYKHSIPLLVVEAKSPSGDIHSAYAEACLYALEINKIFGHNINPCCRVIACDGVNVLAGHWDAEPEISVSVNSLEVASSTLDQLVSLVGSDRLEQLAAPVIKALRSSDFRRPFNHPSGNIQITSRIEPNTFAADLAPTLRRYFSSRDQSTDEEIYSRAYISSNEITSYDHILESFLRARLPKTKRRNTVLTTKKKSALVTGVISQFDKRRPSGGELQLITGGVGVGKSLFARRYKEILQPDALAKKNHWAFLDFNNSPEDSKGWPDWVCETFTRSIVEEGAPLNLREAADQERVFADDLEDRKAYYDRMESVQVGRGTLEKARDIEQWRQTPLKLATGIARFLQGDRGENLVVVFDNVDRRESVAQLAAFQIALWFMYQTRCLVILQMRDSTFELYKNEPPLDTYRTGQIFHITPPRFVDVVRRRLELSLEALAEEAPEQISYTTKSGVKVTYPKSRAGVFLRLIYEELFRKPNNVSRVLEALAGRNVRRSLDMFMAIITSGHMPEDVIAAVARGIGSPTFPEHLILRALMRQDYRFFNNHSGFIANIFNCDSKWERPSNLLIPELLFFLLGQRKVRGDNGQLGFVALPRLLFELESIGYVKSDVKDAAHFCLGRNLLEVETSSADTIGDRDHVKASAGGWAHMRILSSRVEYLAGVLPTTPMNDKTLAARIYDGLTVESRTGPLSLQRSLQLIEGFETYLRQQDKDFSLHPGYIDRDQSGSDYVLKKLRESILHARAGGQRAISEPDALDG
jgi:hypothetical protein